MKPVLPILAPKKTCTGCRACAAACPKGALTMAPDPHGFLRPVLKKCLCIGCHACERACPVLNPLRAEPTSPLACYAARTKDNELRLASSSGGMFTELARPILAQGGIVVGCILEPGTLKAIHTVAETEADLATMRGSKYVQSDLRDVHARIKAALKAGRKVLFTGTPCQVAGIRKFLGTLADGGNFLAAELICHGSPAPAVFEVYKQSLERSFKTSLESISFRKKISSWKRCSLVSTFVDTRENQGDLYADPYMVAFLRNYCLRPSCYDCHFRAGRSGADITMADFWGIERVCPELDDDRGTSAVIVHSPAGVALWESITERLEMAPVALDAITPANPNFFASVRHSPTATFFMMLYRLGLSIRAATWLAERPMWCYHFPFRVLRFLKRKLKALLVRG